MVALGLDRGSFPIIRNGDLFGTPHCAFEREDGVAGVRRPSLHLVRVRMIVSVGGKAHAAGIDNQAAVREPGLAREVGMATESQPGVGWDTLGNGSCGRVVDAVGVDIVEKVNEVAMRRTVAQKDIRGEPLGGGQGAEPGEMLGSDLLNRVPVGGTHRAVRESEQLPFVVAADGGKVQGSKTVSRFSRPEGAGEQVTEVDDGVDATPGNVGQDRLEGG